MLGRSIGALQPFAELMAQAVFFSHFTWGIGPWLCPAETHAYAWLRINYINNLEKAGPTWQLGFTAFRRSLDLRVRRGASADLGAP
jgi:hypothetical protein